MVLLGVLKTLMVEHNNHRGLLTTSNIMDNDFILFGLGSSSDDVNYVNADATKGTKENRDNYTYLTNSNTLNKVIFTQSIRYDNYDNFDSKATGKLGIKI